MKVSAVKLVFFSPTNTTKRIIAGIAQAIEVSSVEQLDLTPPAARTREFEEMQDELTIIGAPVYGGRIPPEAVQRLRRLKANSTPAVVVVVYGNREYEDALLELHDLTTALGFRPVAAAAFIGEHSYDTRATPIATGRPDLEDLARAKVFAQSISKKMATLPTLDELPPLTVPGNFPYQEWHPPPEISPVTDDTLCAICGTCAGVCPTAAITITETVITDRHACILCTACVKNCPTGARIWRDLWIARVAEWLSTNCSARKEPEFFL